MIKSWLTQLRRRGQCESAQALIELALSAPLLMLMLLGGAEFGMMTYAAIEVSNAARTAVQYGAMNGGNASDTTGMLNAAAGEMTNLSNVSTNLTWASGYPTAACQCANGGASTCSPGDCSGSFIEETVTVKLQYTYTPLIHWPFIPTITLNGYAQQQVLGL